MTDLENIALLKSPIFRKMKLEVFNGINKLCNGKPIGINHFSAILLYNFPEFKEMTYTSEIHPFYSEYLYYLYGEKEYQVHPNLVKRFNSTNIRSVPTEFFRLPFKSIKISLQTPNLKFLTPTGYVYADSITLCELDEGDTLGDETLKEKSISHDNPRGCKGIKVVLSKVPYFTYFWIWLDKGEVHQCVDASIEFSRNQFNSESSKEEYLKMKEYEIEILKKSLPAYYVDEIREEFVGNVKFTDDKAKAIREQFEFVIKCVLYINGANADLYWKDDRKHLEAQLGRAKSAGNRRELSRKLDKCKGLYQVGHKIILSREEKEMYDGIVSGRIKSTSKWIVSGHFRNQPYGEKSLLRKIIFIDPFWVGNMAGEELNNKHLVK